MRWFDTHCHLDRLPAGVSPETAAALAKTVGVERIVVPGVVGSPERIAELAGINGVSLAWGVHPEFIEAGNSFYNDPKPWDNSAFMPVAIGECGLDRRSRHSLKEQEKFFIWQLELAEQNGLPAIVHLVGHYQRAYELLAASGAVAIMHAWSGSAEMAKRFVALRAFISISGGHLRRPEKLEQLIAAIPLSSLLLETDAPDMVPPFWRGKYNEPAALPQIGAVVAEKAGLPVEKLSEILYNNSVRLFGERKQIGITEHG